MGEIASQIVQLIKRSLSLSLSLSEMTYHVLDGEQQLLEERRRVYLAQRPALRDVIVELTAAYPLRDQIDASQRLDHLKEPAQERERERDNRWRWIGNSGKTRSPQYVGMMDTLERGYLAGEHAQRLRVQAGAIQVNYLDGHLVCKSRDSLELTMLECNWV